VLRSAHPFGHCSAGALHPPEPLVDELVEVVDELVEVVDELVEVVAGGEPPPDELTPPVPWKTRLPCALLQPAIAARTASETKTKLFIAFLIE
jgi:hypothetical protein